MVFLHHWSTSNLLEWYLSEILTLCGQNNRQKSSCDSTLSAFRSQISHKITISISQFLFDCIYISALFTLVLTNSFIHTINLLSKSSEKILKSILCHIYRPKDPLWFYKNHPVVHIPTMHHNSGMRELSMVQCSTMSTQGQLFILHFFFNGTIIFFTKMIRSVSSKSLNIIRLWYNSVWICMISIHLLSVFYPLWFMIHTHTQFYIHDQLNDQTCYVVYLTEK